MKVILGGGITGLVLLELLKGDGAILFTDYIGGQMAVPSFPMGPRILHSSDKVVRFLKALGAYKEPKQFKVGYMTSTGKLLPVASEADRVRYYYKTRGLGSKVSDSCMSGGKSEIIGWDMQELGLVDLLIERNSGRIVTDMALEAIHPDARYMEFRNGLSVSYDELVSTIDLSKLVMCAGDIELAQELMCDRTFVNYFYIKVDADEVLRGYDYIYDMTESAIHRITKVDAEHIVIEACMVPSEIEEYSWDVRAHSSIMSRLVNERKLESYKGITLVGRYAQYDHSIKVNDVVERFWVEENMPRNLAR